jgi:NADH-quinone oxidoreductase subunit L
MLSTPAAIALGIFLAPFIGFLVITFLTRPLKGLSGFIAVASMGTSFVLSLALLPWVLAAPDYTIELFNVQWLDVGPLAVDFGMTVDPLTMIMLIVVTLVSTLVQVYSNSYLHGDKGFSRFFIYMCVFTASMLGLVLSNDLIFIFIFWELVGLCSFLLIGFWFSKPAAAAAAKKAFIVTRIGDFGFMIGIMLVYVHIGTFNVPEIIELSAGVAGPVLAAMTICIFAGAVGKSAQFPLHFWLPDAMEGPTPVSALVHSATMVAAGVYLVARLFPMFVNSPDAMLTVALIGGFTAVFAASMGLVMHDIKRVLAYSTISQLGLMMLSLGVGGFIAAVFHLMTHAFFKAMLFLGSGSVNHATNTYDMRLMGGLRKFMPITYGTFLIGALALTGIPPFSGFWSKDEVILYVFNATYNIQPLLVFFALATPFMTSFYIFRLLIRTFHGEYAGGAAPEGHGDDDYATHGAHGDDTPVDGHAPAAAHASPLATTRADATTHHMAEHDMAHDDEHGDHASWKSHPHESPALMVIPLIVLAVLAFSSGFIGTPFNNFFAAFLEGSPVFKEALEKAHEFSYPKVKFDWAIAGVSTAFALAGIALAYAIYQFKIIPANFLTRPFPWLYTMLSNKYGVDIFAEDLVVRRAFNQVLCTVSAWFDRFIIDGVVNGVARVTVGIGTVVRLYETGQVQVYGFSIFIGLIVIIAGFVLLRPPV